MPVLQGAQAWRHDAGPVGALVLHGFCGSPVSVRPWAEHLAADGLTVSVPRLPGHGTRWQDANRTIWQDWFAEAQRAFVELQEHCDQVVVLGLSVGGCLALRLAETRGPAVRGVVVVNPSLSTTDRRARFSGIVSKVVPSAPGIVDDIAKPGVTEGGYDRLPTRAFHSLRSLWSLTLSELPRVTQPLLVFTSAQDHVVEPANSDLVLAGVSSRFKEQCLLPRSFHVATLDYDAPVIFDGSLSFVRRLTRAAEAS
ncbi:MAG: carboxylesterase [Frankiales bacterium]|nr:carboxylesterase [Frankiales bacterium]